MWNPDFSNLQGKWKSVRKIGGSSKIENSIESHHSVVLIRTQQRFRAAWQANFEPSYRLIRLRLANLNYSVFVTPTKA